LAWSVEVEIFISISVIIYKLFRLNLFFKFGFYFLMQQLIITINSFQSINNQFKIQVSSNSQSIAKSIAFDI